MRRIDRIKNLSVEEFAEWYSHRVLCAKCDFNNTCMHKGSIKKPVPFDLCEEHLIGCLNEEVSITDESQEPEATYTVCVNINNIVRRCR